jgi:hypothetical protein
MKNLFIVFMTGLLLILIGCEKDLDFIQNESEFNSEKQGVNVRFSPEVETAIIDGINYLLTHQQPDGSFGADPGENVARTALVIAKLCDRSKELNQIPSEGDFGEEILSALDFLLMTAVGKGGGIVFNPGYHETYTTSISLLAITAFDEPNTFISSGNPVVDGKTYSEVANAVTNFFINAQKDDGGWRYLDVDEQSDQSNTGFVALGLLAAEQFGCNIPQTLKNRLSAYIDYTQNDVSGGCGYTGPDDWVNILKTGNLLFEMAFVGDTKDSDRAQLAMQYIKDNWDSPSPEPGWFPNNYLAMYTLMKGFVTMGIESFEKGGITVNWYDEFVAELLLRQEPDGHWEQNNIWIGNPQLATVFNLLILEKSTPVSVIGVSIDFKPTSCPSAFNRKNEGVTPMAILGTEDFDATQVDPETVVVVDPITEQEIGIVKFSLEDVATPYEGDGELDDKFDCSSDGLDGYMDFVFHVSSQELATLPSVIDAEKGDVVPLKVRATTFGSLNIVGIDILYITK